MAFPNEVEQRWRTCAWCVYVVLAAGYLVYCGLLIQRAYVLSKHPIVATFTDSRRTVALPYVALCLDETEYLSDCAVPQHEIGRLVSRCLVRDFLEQPEVLPKFGEHFAEIDERLPDKWYESPIFNKSANIENLGKSNPGADFEFNEPDDSLSNCKAELIPEVQGFAKQNTSLFCLGYDLTAFVSEQPSGPKTGAIVDLYLGLSDYTLPSPYFSNDWTSSGFYQNASTPSSYCSFRQTSAGFCGPSCNSIQVYLAQDRSGIAEKLTERGVGIYTAFADQTALIGMDVTYREPYGSSPSQTAFFKPVDTVVLSPEQQAVGLCNAEGVHCSGAGLDVYYVVSDQDYYIFRLTLSANNVGVSIQQEQNPWLSLISTIGGAWFLIPLTFGLIFVAIEQQNNERFRLISWSWVREQVMVVVQATCTALSYRRKRLGQAKDMDIQLRSMGSESAGGWDTMKRENVEV